MNEELSQQAHAWLVRMRRTSTTAADREALRAWKLADPARKRAYEDAERLWESLSGPAHELGAGGWHRQSVSRGAHRRQNRWILAAAACLAFVAVSMWWRDPGMFTRSLADFSTRPGVSKDVVLADHSRVLLDGDSAIEVHLTA